ncbi:DNA topoisomerase [Actinomyces denticolens]|nr:DNA topoisomerase [Actinomyces denticolens]
MPRKLVIVESPNKVRSIAGYLGPDFDVEASVGHIRDLAQPSELPAKEKKGPYGRFAVDVEDGFKPYYVVNPDKKKTVTALKKALKEADELYLATDDDREGEAIAWHLLEVLKPKVPVKRMTFTEITKEAVTRALDSTRDIDSHRVDAQETRRILDRLVGYEVSPVLWRKVRAGLSAGRVQSVATRLVVERERERMAFVPAGYWGVEAALTTGLSGLDAAARAEGSFTARLSALDGRRVATGRDFTDGGELTESARKAGTVHLHEGAAKAIAEAVMRAVPRVAEVEDKPYRRRPAAPFTTSTLQQEASRKLRMNPRETMRVAQGLYENGFITYMRTDSTVLSGQAVAAARAQVAELYGPEYVPAKARVYATKTKGAQEAHEAIRPAGDHFRTPAQVSGELSGAQFRLYELIWKRTVASQMADAVGSTATVRVEVPLAPADGGSRDSGQTFSTASFTASGTVITFRGFLAAYEEGATPSATPRPPRAVSVGPASPAARGGRRGRRCWRRWRERVVARDAPARHDRRAGARGPRRRGRRARDHPAAALHRGVPGQGTGGARDRPPLHLRRHDVHHLRSRLRGPPGPGPRAHLAGLRRHAPAGGELRRAGGLRLHRLHGGRPRPHRRRGGGPGRLADPLLLRGRRDGLI